MPMDLCITKWANAIDAIVIDQAPAFRSFVADTGQILEMGPYDHHWNGNTVQILADLISKRLPQLPVKD